MHAALRALLTEIVDYAGMFPPAREPLEQAFESYVRYRSEPEAWMLARFIVPAGRLDELASRGGSVFSRDTPFRLSVLAGTGEDAGRLLTELNRDLAKISAFAARCGESVSIEALELKVPPGVAADDDLLELFNAAAATIDDHAPVPMTPFWELPAGKSWNERIDAAACALSIHNLGRREAGENVRARPAGLKLRCGGESPEAFPPASRVARALVACRETKVSLKATAGLHHPVRHERDGVTMHGFLNVFGAGVLATSARLEEREIVELLHERDPRAFGFDGERFSWHERQATAAEIVRARRETVLSFGSCSFDEPRDDLRTLGLI